MKTIKGIIDFFLGILLLLYIHVGAVTLVIVILTIIMVLFGSFGNVLVSLFMYPLYALGISQLIYVVPMVTVFSQRQQFNLMKGVIVGAILTALLNGLYWFSYLNSTLK